MMNASVWRLCAAALLTLGPTGCSAEDAPGPTFTNWPASLNDFRFQWAAEPGIDLLSGPAVPLRAYLESYRIGQLTDDIGNAYPGFERAVPPAHPRSSAGDARAELQDIRPTPGAEPFGPPGPFYGNEYFHILELTPIQNGYRAYVCDGMYNIFRKGEDEQRRKYVSVIAYPARTLLMDIEGMKVWRVEFTDTPPTAGAPAGVTAQQHGPNPAPVDDVFGPWRITGASDFSWGTMITRESTADENLDGEHRISQCSDLLPQWRTERAAIIDSVLDTAPSAAPAAPGWPA